MYGNYNNVSHCYENLYVQATLVDVIVILEL